MELPEKKIEIFIKQHWVLTLATSFENIPWCCTLFYVYLPEEVAFLVTSEDKTLHSNHLIKQNMVAGAIALETSMVGKIRGIQFSGFMKKIDEEEVDNYRRCYIKTFPISALASLNLWKIEISTIKMTDNRLGFGKKLFWNR